MGMNQITRSLIVSRWMYVFPIATKKCIGIQKPSENQIHEKSHC